MLVEVGVLAMTHHASASIAAGMVLAVVHLYLTVGTGVLRRTAAGV